MVTTKPQLRGYGKKTWTICLFASLATSATFAVWFKKNVVERRRQQYIDFYDQWDDDKEYQAMKAANLFKGFEAS